MTPAERARTIVRSDVDDPELLIAEHIEEAIREVLEQIGTPAVCTTCGKAIFWIARINGGRRSPFSPDGRPHTEVCAMKDRPGQLGRWKTLTEKEY